MSTPWVYREQPAPASLATHVRALWTESVGDRADDAGARVLPDGCIDLVWVSGRPPFVAGPATLPLVTTAVPGTCIVGIRFRPGMVSGVLGASASELRDASVPLADLWGRSSLAGLDRAEESLVADDRLNAMQEILLDRLARAEPADELVAQLAAWLARHPTARLDQLRDRSDLGERQLRRRFEAAVGYGPKTFQRIMRFRRWLGLARSMPADRRRLTDLAAEAGYADQAHLTREATRLAGQPPTALLATL